MTTNATKPALLTTKDWAEIYYALESKLAHPEVVTDNEWTAHLENIINTIGPDGVTADDYYSQEQEISTTPDERSL